MIEDEFAPFRPGCQTCSKSSPFIGGGVMRWTPDDGVYPFGPSAEPYRAGGSLTFTPVGEHAEQLPVVVAPIRSGMASAVLRGTDSYDRSPKPTPRRPLVAGILRRLLP